MSDGGARPEPLRPIRGDALEPEQGTRGALSRLVEVLLDKGVYLDLDLLVTVAEVPLLAVDVRAVLAGVETMIEYGIAGPWQDGAERRGAPSEPGPARQQTGAWYREDRAGGPVWREGVLSIEPPGTLQWRGREDRRPAVRITEVLGVRPRGSTEAPRGAGTLEVDAETGRVLLGVPEPERWLALLRGIAQDPGTGGGAA